ncbi:MAG: SUMF1/EgtB/PvdO family nonheme iron enzyme [Bacteroidales bacterium]|nr:SUMF1/EgtB/PvdO family nonheme iron enzyme [Bacteroidales bacterium]
MLRSGTERGRNRFLLGGSFMLALMVIVPLEGNDPDQALVFTNPADGTELLWIPGGEFSMGSGLHEDEMPVHRVRVEGFWLGKYEITNRQYSLFLSVTGHNEPPFWDDPLLNRPDHPVTGIKWKDAAAYCEWAGVRMPTEAEWEYAAAAGDRQLDYGTATGQIDHDIANYAGISGKDCWEFTSPVGSFPANPLGLHDMAGNTWEWCSNIWHPYPFNEPDEPDQGENRTNEMRVMRGGSWHFGPDYCRVSDRHNHREHLMYDYAGFRVALSDTSIIVPP